MTSHRQARNSQFQRGSGVYACECCTRQTRNTGTQPRESKICEDCYELAGYMNMLSDYGPEEFTPGNWEEVRERWANVQAKGDAAQGIRGIEELIQAIPATTAETEETTPMTTAPTAIAFGTSVYVQDQDREDFLGLSNMTGTQLVRMYNELQFELGSDAEVARFADTKSAIRRTWAKLVEYAQAKPETQMKGSVKAADAPHPAIKSITSTQPAAPAKERLKASAAAAVKAKPVTAPATEKKAVWRRAKNENAGKTAYRPEAGTVQAQLYDILTREPGGILMEDYCAAAQKVKTKDATLFTPSSVWGALRYLFVTNRGYGLDFDGAKLKLLVPTDERQSSRKMKQA